ncbi:iron transporter [Deltaproteobacteria bacterium TL4]
MKKITSWIMTLGMVVGAASTAFAFKEYPLGEEKEINHMTIAAVYLKPIDMEPRGMDLPASQADVHLEADIHAAKGNPNAFGAGEWIPYLTINYRLENKDTGKIKTGVFMPMVAADGPHYGSNIKMMGPGNYKLTYTIDPPSKQGFSRHTDKETGVGKWFTVFSVDFEFKYVPLQ